MDGDLGHSSRLRDGGQYHMPSGAAYGPFSSHVCTATMALAVRHDTAASGEGETKRNDESEGDRRPKSRSRDGVRVHDILLMIRWRETPDRGPFSITVSETPRSSTFHTEAYRLDALIL